MSFLIHCKSLTKAIGAQTLFEDIELTVHPGDRIGLIGPNGSGKSTLLKILCGLEECDSGEMTRAKHAKIGYLAQMDEFDEEVSCKANLLQALHGEKIDEAVKHSRVQTLLSRAEFEDIDKKVRHLSGGWRKRLAICRAMLVSPQVLAMDEPTNHLDIEGIIWLEKILSARIEEVPQSVIIVSHDRQFLENSTNRIVELSSVYRNGSFQVEGSYSHFLEKRSQYLSEQQQLEDRLANKMRRETEWLRRGPKARTSKARYRIDQAYKLEENLHTVRDRNRAATNVRFNFDSTGRKTKKLLVGKGLGKQFDDTQLFSDVEVVLSPGTRLGLLGRNGCGKSSLMKMLAAGSEMSERNLGDGTIQTADNITIVHFDQNRETLDHTLSLKRALAPEGDGVVFRGRPLHVVSWAKRFLFKPDQLETAVGELSGGEQARIVLASLMRQPADILLLDEPTNDLDIGSLDVLEESLADFPGALVLVSHDRYLLDRVCQNILGFDGEGGALYFADYQQWLEHLDELQREKGKEIIKERDQPARKKEGRKQAGRLSYKDQREFDQMEDKILHAEELHENLQRKIQSPEIASDPLKLGECWEKLEEITLTIETLYNRWSELEEKKKSD